MEQININGKWKGILKYITENDVTINSEMNNTELNNDVINNDDKKINENEKEFAFFLEISEIDGDIEGKWINTSNDEQKDEISISGFIDEDMISFVKPFQPFDNNKEEKKEQNFDFNTNNNNKDLPEMQFTGEFNKEKNQFEGEWHVVFDVKQKGYFYFENRMSGTWAINKID